LSLTQNAIEKSEISENYAPEYIHTYMRVNKTVVQPRCIQLKVSERRSLNITRLMWLLLSC